MDKYREKKSEQVLSFIDKHEAKWQEDYGEEMKGVAHEIIMDVESNVHTIDFITVDDFLLWFDEVVADDYPKIDNMSFDEMTNLRDIVSDYFNEYILCDMIDLDEEFELIDDVEGLYDF